MDKKDDSLLIHEICFFFTSLIDNSGTNKNQAREVQGGIEIARGVRRLSRGMGARRYHIILTLFKKSSIREGG